MKTNANGFKNDSLTKLMLVVLVFFGLSALVLGVLRLNSLLNPRLSFGVQGENNNLAGNGQTEQSLLKLMQTDTDGDGLSDYDEMYVYHTSIYLKDSDSDGYSDKEEVDNGFDPNCPKGQNCRGVEQNNSQNNLSSEKQPLSSDQTNNKDKTDTSLSNQLTEEQKQQLMNLSPEQIRQLLLSTGKISQAELNKIDDETLKQVLYESLNNQDN